MRQFIGSSFIHLRAGSVYLLAITRTNSNAMMILQFLSKVVDLIKSYCHGDFNEEVIKANFVLIYELLDEILDFGYPQISEPAVLKSLIFQKVLWFGWIRGWEWGPAAAGKWREKCSFVHP